MKATMTREEALDYLMKRAAKELTDEELSDMLSNDSGQIIIVGDEPKGCGGDCSKCKCGGKDG